MMENLIKSNERNNRFSLFILGFCGLSIISLFYSILDIYRNIIFNIFEINLLPNLVNFVNNYSGIVNYTIYATAFVLIILILDKTYFEQTFIAFKDKETYKNGIGYGIVLILASMLVGLITNMFIETSVNVNQNAVNNMILSNPIMSFITVVIMGPIVEEFTYRYGLFGILKAKNKVLAYIVTILLFAFIHFEFTSDPKLLFNEFLNLPSYLVSASVLCIAYDKSDNLAVPIIAHIFNNFISFVMMFI